MAYSLAQMIALSVLLVFIGEKTQRSGMLGGAFIRSFCLLGVGISWGVVLGGFATHYLRGLFI